MNPPATIRILHLEFELRFVDETFFDAASAFGYCDKKRLVICISKGLRPGLLADTTIHECLHAIHFVMGCDEEMLEEQIAMQFSGPLCMLIKDNPELVDWLRGLLNPNWGCISDIVDDGAHQ